MTWDYKKQEDFERSIKGYRKVVMRHLDARDNSKDDNIYKPSEKDPRLPRYVMCMIEDLNSKLPGELQDLDLVKARETFASGHVDYVSKLALYMAEIEFKIYKNYDN